MRLGDSDRARVAQACAHGNTSVWAGGSDPGFLTETLPLAFLSIQRHVELIELEEFGDLSRRPFRGDDVTVVSSMTVFEFDEAGKIRHLDVYLQQPR